MHPWQLAGFEYEHASDMPICWREWAFDLVRCRAVMRQEQQAKLNSLMGA